MSIATPVPRPTPLAQWLAVAAAVVLSLLLAVWIPRVASQSAPEATTVTAGERVAAGGVSVVPPEGWALAGGTELFILSKDDTSFIVNTPSKSTSSAEAAVAETEKLLSADKSIATTFGEVSTFTTESGLSAARVTIGQPDNITVLSGFSDESMVATGTLTTSPASYATLAKEIDAMLKTLEFTDGSGA